MLLRRDKIKGILSAIFLAASLAFTILACMGLISNGGFISDAYNVMSLSDGALIGIFSVFSVLFVASFSVLIAFLDEYSYGSLLYSYAKPRVLRNGPDVEELLGSGANPNELSQRGEAPLHIAAKEGREDLVKLLLEAPMISVDQENSYRETPLHIAAKKGNIRMVNLLLENGADVNKKDMGGVAPLIGVVSECAMMDDINNDYRQVINVLWPKDASYDASCLYLAEIYNNTKLLKILSDMGAKIGKEDGNRFFPSLTFAVHNAEYDNPELLKGLLYLGADPNQVGRQGLPPLISAAKNNNTNCLAVLLAAEGLVIGATNNQGRNALFYALPGLARSLFALKGDPGDQEAFQAVALASLQSPACMYFLLSLLEPITPITIWEAIKNKISEHPSEQALAMLFFRLCCTPKSNLMAAEGKKEEKGVVKRSSSEIQGLLEECKSLGECCTSLFSKLNRMGKMYSKVPHVWRRPGTSLFTIFHGECSKLLFEGLFGKAEILAVLPNDHCSIISSFLDPLAIGLCMLVSRPTARVLSSRIEGEPVREGGEEVSGQAPSSSSSGAGSESRDGDDYAAGGPEDSGHSQPGP